MNNEKIDALKDFGKAQDKIVKDQEKGIEKLNSSIAKVKATIADLDSQIANATLDEATALGERAQEIKEALTGDVSGEEARSLQAELEGIKQLGRANEEVQAAIEEAARQETLTETQKIQEKFALQKQELEAKKAIEEEKLTLLEAQLATEEELLEKNRLIQKAIQEKITNDLLTEIEKRDEAFRDSLELQRQALI